MMKTNREKNNNVVIDALRDNIKLLMIRRKDTHGFVEFMRGKYDLEDEVFLQRIFASF